MPDPVYTYICILYIRFANEKFVTLFSNEPELILFYTDVFKNCYSALIVLFKLVVFYGISTHENYLMPNPIYTYRY